MDITFCESITTAWHIFVFWMEEAASIYGG